MSEYVKTPIERILPRAILLRLSTPAQMLFFTIYNSMGFKGVTRLDLTDDVLSLRCRVGMIALQAAKAELKRKGLLNLFRIYNGRTAYCLPTAPVTT